MKKEFNDNYIKVKERIVKLKEEGTWDNVSINTEIIKIDTQLDITGKQKLFAIIKATVNVNNQTYTAHAMETEGVGDINYLHFIENAETSAVGRALSFAGIRDSEVTPDIASKEEIEQAKEQVKDINIEKRKEIANKLIEQAQEKKQLTLQKKEVVEPKKEVTQFDEGNIPVFKELTGTIRSKQDREEIITWLRKVNKFDEHILTGAMIKAEISYKHKSFNELLHKGTYNDLLTVFKHL